VLQCCSSCRTHALCCLHWRQPVSAVPTNRSLHTHGIAVLRVTAPCHIVSGNQVYGETQPCPSSGYNLAVRPVIRVQDGFEKNAFKCRFSNWRVCQSVTQDAPQLFPMKYVILIISNAESERSWITLTFQTRSLCHIAWVVVTLFQSKGML
jgi:hypothetical protein